jgi:hypothetical protein
MRELQQDRPSPAKEHDALTVDASRDQRAHRVTAYLSQ